MIYKILVTGSDGQLGYELKRLLSDNKNFELFFTNHKTLDITDEQAIRDFYNKYKPNFVINAAAYTAVDKAETEKEIALKVNVNGVRNLAKYSIDYNTIMIHISTDYVFDGNKSSPYIETDTPNPLGYYGYTKFMGENEMSKINPRGVIIRTSWLYSNHGNNFVKTIIKKSLDENQKLQVVYDQIGTPTYARDLAMCIYQMIQCFDFNNLEFFHFADEGVASWYDFAHAIIRIKNIDKCIYPIETDQINQLTMRPKYSVMNKSKIKSALNISIPHWYDSLKEMLGLFM
ncbi:MAG: dTDP-4-dehydrorhamnose reductase [Bacteroidales bacterium]|jgi:dTDP-4-dehydrorhamnose reductase|nr:dTDP-4-dehydrorhamnose reductase [Bacteroidales bacterium]MDI9575053.1 dTDP-4-dehydrorhamnose reductase [Bacteroidota bacterium]MDD3755758.1 dTDP-4-dehydrorhamnose reductase [Bacteroidales bacterium]MDY0401158.1 dTDP-4-dehydrorhamnose reductase [Bacteroidales bacterium]HHW59265.1 dTDP-4-dehydrorhamnose reductase [Bacteroidales bacterium]